MTTIAVINAGMSEESTTARLGHTIEDALRDLAAGHAVADLQVTWVDLRPLAHQIIDNLLTGFPADGLRTAIERVRAADAVVALTPTYQASFSGLFKAFLDILKDSALRDTPVLIGATGGSARHSLVTETAMRPLFIYMHADPVPTAVFAATEDWGAHASDSSGRDGGRLGSRVRRAAGELLDRVGGHTAAPRDAAPPSSVGDGGRGRRDDDAREDYPDFVDFETLLSRGGVR
jgi:FMN reductase